VKEALKWLKELDAKYVEVESDSLKVITCIQNNLLLTSWDLLTNDIRKLARGFVNLGFVFAKRSTNRVAHFLAREALFKSDRVDCVSFPFPSLVYVLELDSI